MVGESKRWTAMSQYATKALGTMKKYSEERERERERERKGAEGKRLYRHETGCRIRENNTAGKMEKNGPGREILLPSTRNNFTAFCFVRDSSFQSREISAMRIASELSLQNLLCIVTDLSRRVNDRDAC